jgi:hypothetical protein
LGFCPRSDCRRCADTNFKGAGEAVYDADGFDADADDLADQESYVVVILTGRMLRLRTLQLHSQPGNRMVGYTCLAHYGNCCKQETTEVSGRSTQSATKPFLGWAANGHFEVMRVHLRLRGEVNASIAGQTFFPEGLKS